MSENYKIILELPYDDEFDSSEVDGRQFPYYEGLMTFRGIYSSFEEAKNTADNLKMYKCIIHYTHAGEYEEVFDSFEGWGDDEPPCIKFPTYGAAENYAEEQINKNCVLPEYEIEELELDDGSFCYRYILYLEQSSGIRDVLEESEEYTSYEAAEDNALRAQEDYDSAYFEIEEIDILDKIIEKITE